MNKLYSLTTLPKTIQKEFLKVRVLKNKELKKHRAEVESNTSGPEGKDLFQISNEDSSLDGLIPVPEKDIITTEVVWGTGETPKTNVTTEDFKNIIPRVEKTREEQRSRTKDKAEVFTPSWVVNLQNNSGDDVSVYKNAFNTPIQGEHPHWEPSSEPIFKKTELDKAVEYISLPRLEITCGEAPYLVSPYDTTTGNPIPVKENNKFYRVGLLDRKLRVASETARSIEEYDLLAETALKNTYGYEWQGDNLLIARLNILNSYLEYRNEFLKTHEGEKLSTQELKKIAEIITWNIWQMDGLKMVLPNSCDEECVKCINKNKEYNGHNGEASVINFKNEKILFEDFIILNK